MTISLVLGHEHFICPFDMTSGFGYRTSGDFESLTCHDRTTSIFHFFFKFLSETRFVDDIVEVDEAGSSNAVGGNGNSSMMCTPSCLTCPVSLEVLCDRSSMHGGNHLVLQ